MSHSWMDPYGKLGWLRPLPLPGPYPAFQIINAKIIEAQIKNLTPSAMPTPVELHLSMTQPSYMAEAKTAKMNILNIRGGLKIPHLHFEDKIYLLNDQQWKEFSGKVIQQVQDKLSKAQTVSFEQLMEVSEAVSVLA